MSKRKEKKYEREIRDRRSPVEAAADLVKEGFVRNRCNVVLFTL